MKTVTIPGNNRRQFMVRAASALAGLSFGAPSMLNAVGSSSGYSSREVAATPVAEALTSGEMKNPVCIFSKHLQWLDFDDMGAFLRDLGYGGIDLTVRRGGHVAPDAVSALLPKAVRTLRKYGVAVPMMATNINDPDDPLTEQILRVASGEGIRFYRMQYYKYPKEKNILEALEGFRTKMHRLAELNAKYNIHGAYQNHSGNYVGASVWDAWYMLRGLDPRYSGMQFDIRHAVVEGGYSWNVDMQLVRDFIRCTAVKDFIWQKSNGTYKVKNVPLGEGMVDFDAYFGACKQSGINGPVSLHIEYDIFSGPEEEFSKKEKYQIAGQVLKQELDFLLRHMKTAGLYQP